MQQQKQIYKSRITSEIHSSSHIFILPYQVKSIKAKTSKECLLLSTYKKSLYYLIISLSIFSHIHKAIYHDHQDACAYNLVMPHQEVNRISVKNLIWTVSPLSPTVRSDIHSEAAVSKNDLAWPLNAGAHNMGASEPTCRHGDHGEKEENPGKSGQTSRHPSTDENKIWNWMEIVETNHPYTKFTINESYQKWGTE